MTKLRAAALCKALDDAATSLETISRLSGRKTYGSPPIESFMGTFEEVRGYAYSRANAARAALTATTNEAAPALPADWPQPSPDDLITVAHITLDGVTLTLEINQLGDLVHLVGEEEQTYELRIAPMRRGDFEDLGEFDGF